jgi:hypothetical protein
VDKDRWEVNDDGGKGSEEIDAARRRSISAAMSSVQVRHASGKLRKQSYNVGVVLSWLAVDDHLDDEDIDKTRAHFIPHLRSEAVMSKCRMFLACY